MARARSTRDRPAKAPLSEDAVVDAGLAILAAEGLAAVTLRRVAAALDTGAASLYVYVAGREGLLRAMQERILATVELPAPDPSRWREQVHALLDRIRVALAAHPGIAAAATAEPPTSAAALVLQDNLLGLLRAGDLGPRDAAWTADVLLALTVQSVVEAEARRAAGPQLAETLHATFAALPPDRFPHVTAHADDLVSGSRDERFRFGVDAVLDGVLARSAQPETSTKV